jgi:hypothetical protein
MVTGRFASLTTFYPCTFVSDPRYQPQLMPLNTCVVQVVVSVLVAVSTCVVGYSPS